jgi:F-type H+-transporting ATPase subunit epsilon
MSALRLVIQTPDGVVFEGPVQAVVAPGLDGYFGVQPGHATMVSGIATGAVRALTPEGPRYFVVGEGLAEVHGGEFAILAEYARAAADPGDAEGILQGLRRASLPPPA